MSGKGTSVTRKLLMGICIILLIASSAVAQETGEQGPAAIPVLSFQDARYSETYHARRLAEYAARLAEWVVPGAERALRYQVYPSRPENPQVFGAVLSGHEMRIYLPPEYGVWSRDRESVAMLVSWMLLARMGLSPDKESLIRHHWIVSAVTRKVLSNADATSGYSNRFYPVGTALTAEGIYPQLNQVISGSLEQTDGALRMVQDEYCELLFDACSRSNLLKNQVLSQILRSTLRRSVESEYELFQRYALPSLKKRAPKVMTGDWNKSDSAETILDQWFRDFCTRTLLSRFSPCSSRRFELLFRQMSRVEVTWKEGGRDTIALRDLPEKREKIKNLNEVISALSEELSGLSQISARELQVPLSILRLILAKCRTEGGEPVRKELIAAEESLFAALSARMTLDLYLRQVEIQRMGPGTRLEQSLFQLNQSRLQDRTLFGSKITELLDRWDR